MEAEVIVTGVENRHLDKFRDAIAVTEPGPSTTWLEKGFDVAFPSVCCEYHWLIKKLLWTYSRAIGEQS